MDAVQQVVVMVRLLHEDPSCPKGMREKLVLAEQLLVGQGDLTTRKSKVIALLEPLTDDPNLPSMSRTQLFSVISQLEIL